MVSTLTRISMGTDGGYKGIVVKIDNQVDQDHYPDIIDNIKVKKTSVSIHFFIWFILLIIAKLSPSQSANPQLRAEIALISQLS